MTLLVATALVKVGVPRRAVASAPEIVADTFDLVEYPTVVCSAWLAIDFAVSTSFCSEVMPVLAACRTCTPLPMLSRRLLMSLARLLRPCAVKKLVGLSRAEFTLLPVARRFWVVDKRSAVDWSERRFWRTDAERTILDMFGSFWVHSQFFDVARVSEPDLTSAENEGSHSNRTAPALPTVNADLNADRPARMYHSSEFADLPRTPL